MGLLENIGLILHSSKKREVKRHRRIQRSQLNFECAPEIIIGVRTLAQEFEVPTYLLCEHLLQLGAMEIQMSLVNEFQKLELKRHLYSDHLKTVRLDPSREPQSQRAANLEKAINLLTILEKKAGDSAEVDGILSTFIKEAGSLMGEKVQQVDRGLPES